MMVVLPLSDRASHSERLEILDAVDLSERFKKTLPLLLRQIEVSQVDSFG